MSINPFITIVTVCYNSEKTIERTIKSVLSQQFTDYEYLMVYQKILLLVLYKNMNHCLTDT